MRYRRLALAIVAAMLAVTLIACTNTGDAANETLHLQSEELVTAFTERLDEAGFWYEVISPTSLHVKAEDYEKAVQLLYETAQEFLPDGRATAFESSECQRILKSELDKAGVEYRLQMHDGLEWVIWEEQDSNKVEEIVAEVSLRSCY